jgi:hypothetical protein
VDRFLLVAVANHVAMIPQVGIVHNRPKG